MGDSRASGKKPINEVEKLRARVAILESENSKPTKPSSADEELGKAWAEWEKTFDAARDSIMVIDSEFKISQANLATSRLLGKPVDEIVGQTCWQVVHGTEEPPEKCPLKVALYSKNHEEMELHVPEKDIWIEVSTDPILDEQGNINRTIHIIRDITERKKAEYALRESEEQFKNIFNNTLVGLYRTTPDGRILMANPAIVRMLGYESFDQLVSRNLEEEGFEAGYSRSDFKKRIEAEGRIVGLESAWKGRDGSTLFVVENAKGIRDDNGNTLYYEGTVEDITERKLAEVALKDRERELSIRNRIANIFLTIPDEKMYAEVLDVILEVLASEFGTFGYFDDGGNFVCPALTRTIYWNKCNVPDKEVIFERGQFAGIWGQAVKERKVLYCNTGPFHTPKGHIPIENTMVAPIIYRGEIISAIHIANKPGGYDEKDCALLKTVAKHMAPILNARLERDRKEKERKNAENRIREQGEFLRSTIESLSHPFYVIDANDYTIQMANRAALGSRSCTGGITCYGLMHRSDKPCEGPEHICLLKRIKETKRSLVAEHVHLDENGNERIVEVHAHPILDSQDNVVRIIEYCLDITERKRTKDALKESEKRFRDIADNASEWIWEVDSNGKYTYVSPVVERVLGYKPDEMLQKHFYDLFYPDDKEELKREAFEVFASKEGFREFMNRNVHKNGKVVWLSTSGIPIIDERGELVGYRGADIDITERKKAEQALAESEARLSAVFEKVPAVLLLVDQDRRVHLVNEAATRFARRTANQMTGLRGGDALRCLHFLDDPKGCGYGPFCDICVVRNTVLETFETDKNFYQREAQLPFDIHGETNELSLLVSTTTLKVLGRQMALVCLEDITERKKVAEELRKSEEQYRMLAETMNDGLVVLDEKGMYVYVNSKFREMLAYSPGEVVGRHWTDFFDKDAQKIINEQLTERRKGIAEPYELTNTRKDGQKIFLRISPQVVFDEDGTFKGSFAVIIDITERKKAEEEIERLAKFPAENPNPVLRIAEDGTILYANSASSPVLETWGCRQGQRLPDDCYKRLEHAVDSGKAYSFEFDCHDGRIFLVTLAPVAGQDYVNAYGLDITERKRAEDRLLEDQAKLKAMASKMLLTEERERQEIASGLHDDIIQPLVFLDIKLKSLVDSDADSRLMDSFKEMRHIVSELIPKTRTLTFDLSYPVLYELGLEAAIERWQATYIKERHGLDIVFTDDRKAKPLDDEVRTALFKATKELLTNIVKHAHANVVEISVAKEGDNIAICVKDDGEGFELDRRIDHLDKSSGFGLFSIREQLDHLGGNCNIKSEPGRGTSVLMTAPLKKEGRHS